MSGDFAHGETRSHTPPLGHKALTPFYDFVIALLTRERKWRNAFVREISPGPGDKIIDIGSGTGSLAIAIHKVSPQTAYYGIDPDADAVQKARTKAAHAQSNAKFDVGYFSSDMARFDGPFDKIISSLVLHQVPVAEKRRIIEEIFEAVKPGGSVHIADYGLQKELQRLLFRVTVQALDGIEDTTPNAEGIIPELLSAAGFTNVAEAIRIPTLTGTISIYSGRRRQLTEN